MERVSYKTYRDTGRELEFKGFQIPFLLCLAVYLFVCAFLFWALERLGCSFLFLLPTLGAAAIAGGRKWRKISQSYGIHGLTKAWLHHYQPKGLRAAPPSLFHFPTDFRMEGDPSQV